MNDKIYTKFETNAELKNRIADLKKITNDLVYMLSKEYINDPRRTLANINYISINDELIKDSIETLKVYVDILGVMEDEL